MNKGWKRDVKRLLLVILGAVILAVNTKSFVRTGGLYPGGFNGLTLLLQAIFERYLGIQVPYTPINLLLNAGPIVISFLFIGRKFTIFSCVEIVLASILTDAIPGYPITYDSLLIGVFGGIINGLAICLCLFADATSGGTDFIAIFMSERYNRDVWNYIFAFNVVVLMVAGLLFGWDKALYSIIFQFATTQVLNAVYKRYQKCTLFIVTQKPEDVYRVIVENTNHGATLFRGRGLYENKERDMVYSVVSADEMKKVLAHVRQADEHAFVNCLKTDALSGQFYKRPND